MVPKYSVGDVVVILNGDQRGVFGIVSHANPTGQRHHILVLDSGDVVGRPIQESEIALASNDDVGAVQLASKLIALSSHIIEKRLI